MKWFLKEIQSRRIFNVEKAANLRWIESALREMSICWLLFQKENYTNEGANFKPDFLCQRSHRLAVGGNREKGAKWENDKVMGVNFSQLNERKNTRMKDIFILIPPTGIYSHL